MSGQNVSNKKKPDDSMPFYHLIKNKVILIVDDDASFRRMLKMMLREGNFDFVEACNGQEALQKLTYNHEINLVLIDIDMPKMDGIQLLRAIRSQEVYSRVPAIMVTARSDQKTIVQAIKTGAVDYLVKPVDKKVLLQKICIHLGLEKNS